MTTHTQTEAQTAIESGTEVFVALNKLKKSPKNARKTPHGEAAIEALAASIAAKGMLQNLVVVKRRAKGTPYGRRKGTPFFTVFERRGA
jgi:ParB family chromosome partitioning protein